MWAFLVAVAVVAVFNDIDGVVFTGSGGALGSSIVCRVLESGGFVDP